MKEMFKDFMSLNIYGKVVTVIILSVATTGLTAFAFGIATGIGFLR